MIFAAAAAGISAGALASSLQVSPISLDIPVGQSAVAITLRNTGDSGLHAQVRVFGWSQVAADDQLAVTGELVASPPIVEIPARATQVVRLVRTSRGRVDAEHCYRLLIDEIPEDSSAGGAQPAVSIRLRYSVPVFLHATNSVEAPNIAWSVRAAAGGWILRASNLGDSHVRLSSVTLSAADGTEVTMSSGLLGYALSHSARDWPVPRESRLRTGTPVRVTATQNDSTVTSPARDESAVLDARLPAAAPPH